MSGLGDPKNQREPQGLPEDIEQLFNRLFSEHPHPPRPAPATPCSEESRFCPEVDLWESDGHVTLKADLPGVDPRDVEILISGDYLTLRGLRKPDRKRKSAPYLRAERPSGIFERTVELPSPVNDGHVKITCRRGTLTVVLEKRKGEE